MRTALVTGGAGFIGSHLVERLVRDGWTVRVLDDLSTGHEENLEGCGHAMEMVRGDIRDDAALARAVRGAEVVFHQAAVASVPRSVAEPVETHDVNVTGTLRLLEACRRAGTRRVVLASSCAIYGPCVSGAAHEELAVHPASPYALQKWQAERTAQFYTDRYGLETVVLRYFNVFGPRQDPQGDYASVIPRFVAARLEGRAPTLHGDGEQTRDFVHVSDTVEANVLAADAREAVGAALNVGSGRATSINQLLELVTELVGPGPIADRIESRSGDVRESRADLARAAARLGFQPAVSLREGLAQTTESLRKRLGGDSRT